MPLSPVVVAGAEVVAVVDSDAGFHGNRHISFSGHRPVTLGDDFRMRHQAGAKLAALHLVARAADIDVDFVILISVGLTRGVRH